MDNFPLRYALLAVALMVFIIGCSSGITSPPPGENPAASNESMQAAYDAVTQTGTHFPLGFYSCTADPAAGTLEIEPMRFAEQHINAVFFLQGGPEQLITIESPPKFSEGGKKLDVDIGIKHWMADPVWTGFDVRAILISEGSITGWADSSVKLAGPNETRLINSDGYTRWWNPMEFTHGGIYGYLSGYLGQQILPGKAAILNGYKYYADGLGPDDGMDALNTGLRGMFSAGSKLIRHFTISLKGGLKFNYAVDASWSFPTKVPPTPPGDFPLKANQPEPYRIKVDVLANTLWNDGTSHGGNLLLHITAYDWQGIETIGGGFVEIPNLGLEKALNEITEVGDNYITWVINAYEPNVKKSGPADILVTVYSPEGNYQPAQTGVNKFLRSYNLHVIQVGNQKPAPIPPVAIATAETSTDIAKHEAVIFDGSGSYDPDGITLVYEWDFNGDGIYGDPYDSGTDKHPTVIFHAGGVFNVDLKVTDADLMSDTLDEKIIVSVSNQPPTAYALMSGEPPYYANANYTFDGSSSFDPDGEISTYAWDFDYDGVTFDPDDYGETIKHHFPVGTFSIMLCVYDDDGAFDFIDEPITRKFEFKDNWPPEIDYVEQSRTTTLKNSYDERVMLTVYFSDLDPFDSHTFEWSCEAGEFNVTDQQTVEWTSPDKVGHYYITVRVTDLFGEWAEDSSTMIRVTKYPTGNDPAGFTASVPAPGWSLTKIPDQTTVKFSDYSPGNVVYINFWLST